jgi:hypothetical protein
LTLPLPAVADHDPRFGPDPRQQPPEALRFQRNTTGRRAEARPRHVNEYSASPSGHPRSGVVVELDNQVIEMISPPKPIARLRAGALNRLIIPAIFRFFDPGVVACDTSHRKQGRWVRQPIGPPPQPHEPEYAAWRRSVALALVGRYAGEAEGNRDLHRTSRKPTARFGARSRPHPNHRELA